MPIVRRVHARLKLLGCCEHLPRSMLVDGEVSRSRGVVVRVAAGAAHGGPEAAKGRTANASPESSTPRERANADCADRVGAFEADNRDYSRRSLTRHRRPINLFREDPKSSPAAALTRLGVLLATLLLAHRAFAQERSSCPDRAAVRAALSALVGRADFVENERATLDLADLGDRYRVTVNGQSREYSDPARDCQARAQVAAVFTALVLNPSDEATAEPPPEARVPRVPEARPAAKMPVAAPVPPTRARQIDVRVGASESWAFAEDGAPHAAGVLLRGAYAPGALGVELGLGLPASAARLAVGPVRAQLLRYPLDLSGRYGFRAGPLGVDVEAGAVLSVLRVRNESNAAVTRLEPGVRLGAGLRLSELRVSPALGLFCSLIPVRYPLALEPSGVLARTPAVWVGAWFGLSATFD